MNISKSEAEAALSDIEQAALHTHTRRRYRIVAPILVLWGVIWLIGYIALGARSDGSWNLIWLPLDLIGFIGTMVLIRRGRSAAGCRQTTFENWRWVINALAIFVLLTGTYAMFNPSSAAAYMAYPGLLTGFAYVIFGMTRMPRLAWIGAAMFALTLIGFFHAREILAYWMAAVGGGGLILGGLWLRKL